MVIFKTIKAIKFKIKHKYEIMMVNKYYRQMILSDKKRSRNIKKIKDDSLVERQRDRSFFSVRNANAKLSPKVKPEASPKTKIKEPNFLLEVGLK